MVNSTAFGGRPASASLAPLIAALRASESRHQASMVISSARVYYFRVRNRPRRYYAESTGYPVLLLVNEVLGPGSMHA
jgi:hypothetical protein